MSREKVLSLLLEQGDRYVSGEAMSRALGISRAAVWKAIEALRQEGYVIQSAPNRGYRLENAPDRVREGELSGPLAGCRVGGSLMCLETIDSTNTEAKRQAMAGAPDGLVIVSEEQTGGRGRRGRSFQSPKGKGLYLTALLRPRLDPSQVPTSPPGWRWRCATALRPPAASASDQVDQRPGAERQKAVRHPHRAGAGEREQRPGLLNHRHRDQCEPHPRGF